MIRENNFGITLIEVLLVLGMVGIFFSITIPVLQTFNRNQSLKSAAVTIKNDLRQAQDNAFSGRKLDKGLGCATNTTLLGWYVYFETSASTSYEVRGLCSDGLAFSGKNITLPSGVSISAIRKYQPAPTSAASPLYILFRTSRQDIGFYSIIGSPFPGTEITGTTYQITLTLNSANHYIYIVNSGEIYDRKT